MKRCSMSSSAKVTPLRRGDSDLLASRTGSREAPRETEGPLEKFFEMQPSLLRVEAVASLLNISEKTVYDWRYRSLERNIPPGLFVKFNGFLYLQTEVLKRWMLSQNPSLVAVKGECSNGYP